MTTRWNPPVELSARRVWEVQRTAPDLNLDQVGLLRITVGVYQCRPCRHHFRAQPPFIRPGATYTNRVVRSAVSAVLIDGMPIGRVPERMARDFWLRPSEASIRLWCREYAQGCRMDTNYEPWLVRSFSGVLCVDEVYQDRLALLVAVDPGAPDGDRLVTYELHHGAVSKQEVDSFLRRIRSFGLEPEQVVTDGSALYPSVLADLWPEAVHQLCLFHQTLDIVETVDLVARLTRSRVPQPPAVPKQTGRIRHRHSSETSTPHDRGARIAYVFRLRREGIPLREISRRSGHSINTVRRWLRGTSPVPEDLTDTEIQAGAPAPAHGKNGHVLPIAPEGWRDWDHVRRFQEDFRDGRYLLTTRWTTLDAEQSGVLERLFEAPPGAALRVAHEFAQRWYGIWKDERGQRRGLREAQSEYNRLREDPEAGNFKPLLEFQKRMTDELFERLSPFLRHAHWEATSNGAERMGRRFRLL